MSQKKELFLSLLTRRGLFFRNGVILCSSVLRYNLRFLTKRPLPRVEARSLLVVQSMFISRASKLFLNKQNHTDLDVTTFSDNNRARNGGFGEESTPISELRRQRCKLRADQSRLMSPLTA